MGRAAAVALLFALLAAGLASVGFPFLEGAAAQGNSPDADPYDGEPGEWEQQVAADARGDVLVTWPGSIDLRYLTVGELFSIGRMESFLFIRVGYNITEPGNETVPVPSEVPGGALPTPPPQVPLAPLVMVNVSFEVNEERRERLSLWSFDYGRLWGTDQGQFVADNKRANGDREVVYVAPLRRFSLEEGDELSRFNVTSTRNTRPVDTMQGFDAASDYLPRYIPVHPLLSDPLGAVPDSVGENELPAHPKDFVPEDFPPEPTPDPTDHVPNQPYPEPPGKLPAGVPKGTPDPQDLQEWDPDHDGPTPWDPDDVVAAGEGLAEDPGNGLAWNATHRVRDGESRFVARNHRQVVGASLSQVGYANFTVENLLTEHEQNVAIFFNGPANTRWLLRYGLDMPRGVKTIPPGGSVGMNLIAAPESLFSLPEWTGVAIFISDWGGIEIEQLLFVSTEERMEDPRQLGGGGLILPERLEAVFVNDEDHFRVNEPRNLMIRVRDADTGQFVSELTGVRAYIYPAAATPGAAPYQLREKPWMDGVYQVPFTFDRPGIWNVLVYFFDYPPGGPGGYPHEAFLVTVDLAGESPPLMPTLAALGSVSLVVAAVWARERLVKAR